MDIASSILETAEDGAKKTAIMYKAFLSYPQLQDYLKVLVDAGLLEYVEADRIYNTTGKGKRFIKMYREVDAMVPKENMLTKVLEK